MAGNLNLVLRIRADLQNADNALRRLQNDLGGVDAAAREAAGGLDGITGSVTRLAAAWIGLRGFEKIVGIADQYKNLQAQLDLVNGSQAGFNATMGRMAEMAAGSRTSLEQTVTLFAAISRGTKELGLSQATVERVTTTIGKANALSGQSAESARAALIQLLQGLQSGVLRGEEFNSVMEQSPRLARALADGLGMSLGKLREFSKEGKLVAGEVLQALLSQADAIDAEFAKLPPTVESAMQKLRGAFMMAVGEQEKNIGLTASLAKGIDVLAESIDVLVNAGLIAAVTAFSKYSTALVASVVSSARAVQANAAQAASAAAVAQGELRLTEMITRRAVAEAQAAQAALAAARADVAAAEAALVRANNIIMVAVRQRMVAQRTAELTAATNALTAAEARATAATEARAAAMGAQAAATLTARNATAAAAASAGVLATAGRSLLAVFGGPAGLVATVAIVAGGFLLFRDNANETTKSLTDMNTTLEESVKKFAALGKAQQIKALADIEKEISETEADYRAAAAGLETLARAAIGRSMPIEAKREILQSINEISQVAQRAAKGRSVDFGGLAKQIEQVRFVSERWRAGMLSGASDLETFSRKLGDLIARLVRMKEAADSSSGAVAGLGASMEKAGSENAKKLLEQLQERLAAARDPSVLGKARRELAQDKDASPEQIAAIEKEARALDNLAAAHRREQEAARARDAYNQQFASLGEQLAQAQQRLANAQAGIDDSTRKATDALAGWLAKTKDAQKLSAAQKDALRQQAGAVDAAAVAYKDFTDAQKRAKEITTGMQGIQIELLKLKGDDGEAARREFINQYRELIEKIQTELAAGNTSMQVHLDAVLELQGLSAAKTQLDGVLARIEKIQDAQGRDENTLQTQIEAGVLTEIEGRDRLLDIHRKTAAELERMRPLLVELSQMPEQVGEDARAALQKLDDQVRQLKSTVGALQGALKEGLTSGITEALTGLAKGTMSLKEAITALGEAVLDAMLKIAAKHIAESATSGIMNLVGSLTGTDADKGTDKGTDSTSEAAAVTSLSTAATGLTTVTGTLTQAVTSLASAASTLTASKTTDAASSAAGIVSAAGAVGSTGEGAASALSGAGTLLATAANALSGAGGDLSSGGSALATVASLLTTAASLLMASGTSETTSSVVSAVGSFAGAAAAATGGVIGGFSPNDHADNIPAWLTAGEFVTRRPVMRQPGALAFMTSFNRVGMRALEQYAAHLVRRRGYADGGHVLAPTAPEPAIDTTALARGWRPAEAPARAAATVDNKIQVNLFDDPSRLADYFKTPAGTKVFRGILARDPAGFRAILGV
jgi:tape measure domain-containing protein